MVVNKISQSRPHTIMIRKLSELLVPGNHRPAASGGGFCSDSSPAATSPRSPLDLPRTQSPRGLKNFDLGGVGLGIVAALEKSSTAATADAGYEVLAKHSVCCTPIPVGSRRWRKGAVDEKIIESPKEMEILEKDTYVTTRGGGGGKVYYDGGEIARTVPAAGEIGYPSSDFLNCCHLCKKQLQGLDIYMYRGETAFCSSECRSRQIMIDELQHKKQKKNKWEVACSTSSPPMFSTGILAI